MKTASQSARLHAALTENVDAWYERKISFESFQKHQREIWDAIEAAGSRVKANVQRSIRADEVAL